MNIKRIAFLLLAIFTLPLRAMAPGTFIEPLNHSGQFTVIECKDVLPASAQTAHESASALCSATTDLFKTKGIPVLISSAASAMPWWALTTGTGYLLITQAVIPQEGLAHALIGGASYGVGEKIAQQSTAFTQLALCASCCAVSFASPACAVQEACFAFAQSITLTSVVDATCTLFSNINTPSKSLDCAPVLTSEPSFFKKIATQSANTLKTIMPGICFGIIQTQDVNSMLRILLYEHAYRLAQSGCKSAQEFLSK